MPFDAGSLTFEQVNQMLNTLPFDMTFVDHEGHVKYFTQGKERIFDRPKTIIGRHVSMCHPPQSVHVVEEIVESFRSGKKDNEDFWIKLKDMFVYIRYFAVRSKEGQFLGTLEITQNIKPIRELVGEKTPSIEGLMKIIYILLGFLTLGLGLIGIILPILPTTPFLLLTLFFFAKGSTRFHTWFIQTNIYHKYLKTFAEERSMTRKQKWRLMIFC